MIRYIPHSPVHGIGVAIQVAAAAGKSVFFCILKAPRERTGCPDPVILAPFPVLAGKPLLFLLHSSIASFRAACQG